MPKPIPRLCLVVVLCAAVPGASFAQGPTGTVSNAQRLLVEPPSIVLQGGNRRQQLLVTAKLADGRLLDVTHRCEMRVVDGQVAAASGSVITGNRDGKTEIIVRLEQMRTRVPVRVEGFAEYPPVHFRNDLVPIFTKLGCNSGGCHGKASGQNGFKLSVFGFDPAGDFTAIVKEARGRRVFPADPLRSLILAKPMMSVPHGGGRRIEPGSHDYEVLYQWLRQGMPWGAKDAPHVTGLRVSPTERVVGFRSRQQILATAVFSDGTLRDVTSAAVYSSNAPLVAEVDEQGVVHTGRVPGEAAITVSFLEQVAAVRIQVPRPDGPESYPELPVHNEIDQLVWAKLEKMGIVPSELCDDTTFIRRLYLDAIGTLPTPDEVRAFLANHRQDKRSRLIDRVLDREEFADYWALKWADILLVDQKKLGDRGAYEFHRWLREQFARNRPYDQWVRELITASGDSSKFGPVNFFRALDTPEEIGRSVSQAFLGVRVECAQCHHHPWERWGREDFYGMAGFFNGLVRKPRGDGQIVYHGGHKQMRIPVSNQAVTTRPLGGEEPKDLRRGDPRAALARWLASAKNPWFAKLAANRLWKHYLGRGLIEPEDDIRSTNPPTNEPLLDYLTRQLVQSRFDLKALMRQIAGSRVYQLSSSPNETNADDQQNFSRFYKKRLPAEVLLDAISQVTGTSEAFPGMPRGTRSIQLWNNRLPSYFLEIFGRPERDSPCECGRSSTPTMAQALHLMNAPQIEARIGDASGRVTRLVNAGAAQEKIVEELCLAAMGRPPGEKELGIARRLFRNAPPSQAAEDFLWVLLNSYDFLFIR